MLAHNLDFWIPPVNAVIEDELRGFPLVDNDMDEVPAELDDGSILDQVMVAVRVWVVRCGKARIRLRRWSGARWRQQMRRPSASDSRCGAVESGR